MSKLRNPVDARDHAQGPADAPVTLVEYGDYQCPYCGEAAPLVAQAKAHFGDRLRLVFRNFPLSDMHPQALPAAIVAEYAGTQGRFWEAHDLLYANQDALGPQLYAEIAQRLALPMDGLRAALAGGAELDKIQADFEGGVRSGVNGTPGFFINGQHFQPRESMDELFDAIAGQLDASG